jgi:electron transport complex protein RnfG
MKNAIKFTVVLGLITIAAGLGVSGVYQLTRGTIDKKKADSFAAALEAVFPEADSFVSSTTGEAWDGSEGFGLAGKDGGKIGYLAVGEGKGYASTIRVMVGVNPDFSIKSIRILEQSETPGLGERTKEVASDRTVWQAAGEVVGALEMTEEAGEAHPWFQVRFDDLRIENLDGFVTNPDQKGVQAITGATITSRAVMDAVRSALEAVMNEFGEGAEQGGVE